MVSNAQSSPISLFIFGTSSFRVEVFIPATCQPHSPDVILCGYVPCSHLSIAHCIVSYPTSSGTAQYRIWLRVRRKVLKTAARVTPARGFCRFWARP